MAPSRGSGLIAASASFKTPLYRPHLRAQFHLHRPSQKLHQYQRPWPTHHPTQASARRTIFTSTSTTTATPSPTSLIETGVEFVHSGLTFLHSTVGLPWYVTLPLAAVLVRTTVVMPLMLVGQRIRQQQTALTPKVQEARPELERKVIREHPEMDAKHATRMLSWELMKRRQQLEREAGVRTGLRWVPLAQLPVWLLVIDTVRRMCGKGGGLLSWLSGRDDDGGDVVGVRAGEKVAGAGAETGTSMSMSTSNSLSQADSFDGASSSTTDLLDPSTVTTTTTNTSPTLLTPSTPLNPETLYNPLYTPTFSDGGTLWFPDLLLPDPLLLLPFTLSFLLYHGIRREEKMADALGLQRSRPSRILTNTLKAFSLAVGPLTLTMPAAVMLYWTTSAATGLVQKRVVDWLVPIDREAVVRAVEKGRKLAEERQGAGAGAGAAGGAGGQRAQEQAKQPYRPKRSRRK